MIGRATVLLVLLLGLAGCGATYVEPMPAPAARAVARPADPHLPTPQAAADNFAAVVSRVEPVAEDACRAHRPMGPCNFLITVLNDPRLPPNAVQTIDRSGRPVIAFTVALVATARSQDELAFILGHEAAHHIAGHRERTEDEAVQGALLGGVLAAASGAGARAVAEAQRLGAQMAVRRYSKGFELEADSLGARIAHHAGYDPMQGALFFTRIPDPGDVFLGTHPPNALRIDTVRQTVSEIRAGR